MQCSMSARGTIGLRGSDVLFAASASLLISVLSYFMTDEFIRIWLPRIDAYGSAVVHGFPIPYFAYYPTNEASHLYYPLNFAGDFSIWFAVSLLVISTFTVWRLILASVCGAGVTAMSLFLSPLALSAPNIDGMESSSTSMGFPFEYLIRVQGGFGLTQSVTYSFSLVRAVADYLLWLGIAFAFIGLFALLNSERQRTSIAIIPSTASVGPYHEKGTRPVKSGSQDSAPAHLGVRT
jgi:hypothetical protein